MNLDWGKLHCGVIHKDEILEYVKDPNWQTLRISLKGKSLPHKYRKLKEWLEIVTNFSYKNLLMIDILKY